MIRGGTGHAHRASIPHPRRRYLHPQVILGSVHTNIPVRLAYPAVYLNPDFCFFSGPVLSQSLLRILDIDGGGKIVFVDLVGSPSK